LVLFSLIFLLGGFAQINAQVTGTPPNIRCVSVDAAGDVTLTWVLPSTMSSSWLSFQVYMVGNNTPVATVTNPTQTSVTIPAASLLPNSANSGSISFYIYTSTSGSPVTNSDTLSSMYLSVNNTGGGTAVLNWTAISTNLPQGSDKWYQIYREYDSNDVWIWIDSTQSRSYVDTITYCKAYLNYQVQIANSTICVSSSNQVGSSSPFSSSAPPIGVLDTVSVTSSNTTEISWAKSRKSNVIGYIIYQYFVVSQVGKWLPIDTVYGINTTSFNYSGANPADSALSFEVAALDSCHNGGAISNSQTTLFLRVSPDFCTQTNTLSWNSYQDLAGNLGSSGIGGYKVFVSINNGAFGILGTTTANVTKYIDSNLSKREYRCYYVQVYESANHDTTASSNMVCDSITPPPPPKNNYLRTATVIFNTSEINIVGYVDSTSGAGFYQFKRSSDSAGGFSIIKTITAPLHTDSISYIDNSAHPATQSYRYRIITLDECNKAIDSTNIGQTMLLTANGQSDRINTLSWNDYGDWYDNPAYYLIYRSVDGASYSLVHTVTYSGAGENTYNDNVGGITVGQGTFYYYVKAVENNKTGLYPFTDTSLSNIAEAYQNPTVYIPNAFDPNGVNKIFIPVGVFIDVQGYNFSIVSRWGTVLFQSSDPEIGWNGTYHGKKMEEGVYVYILTYTSSRGEYFQQEGTVTLLR